MPVVYRWTCRLTIRQPISIDVSSNILVEYRSTYRSMLAIGQYVDRHISVDISAQCRPIGRLTYRSTLTRYVDRYISVKCWFISLAIYQSRSAQNTHDLYNVHTFPSHQTNPSSCHNHKSLHDIHNIHHIRPHLNCHHNYHNGNHNHRKGWMAEN